MVVGPAAGCAASPHAAWPGMLTVSSDQQADTGSSARSPAERIDDLRKLSQGAPKLPAAEQERLSMDLAGALGREEDPLVRAQLLRTLAAFSTATAGAMLSAGMGDGDRDVRVACCEAWGRRGGAEAARVLSAAMSSDTDIDVRLAAARALGEVKDPQAVAALGLALEDADPAMQRRAVLSLGESTGRDFGHDVHAWREFVRGANPQPPSLFARLRQWF